MVILNKVECQSCSKKFYSSADSGQCSDCLLGIDNKKDNQSIKKIMRFVKKILFYPFYLLAFIFCAGLILKALQGFLCLLILVFLGADGAMDVGVGSPNLIHTFDALLRIPILIFALMWSARIFWYEIHKKVKGYIPFKFMIIGYLLDILVVLVLQN